MLLNKKKLTVTKNNKKILYRDRNRSDGLWNIKIPYYDVYKIKLQSDSLIKSPPHASMYIGNNRFTNKITAQQESNRTSTIKIFSLEEVVATN